MSVQIVAEIGINHNGNLSEALNLITIAKNVGADMVKFQKRTPRLCVPEHYWDEPKETPEWGIISYIKYREKMEFGREAFAAIDHQCKRVGIPWFLSVWDKESLEFAKQWNVPAIKIGSPMFTNKDLVAGALDMNIPVILSTGMTNGSEIVDVMDWMHTYARIVDSDITLCQCTSVYPCPPELIDLNVIKTYQQKFPWVKVGYSGHEIECGPTIAAVALGATYIERHITSDRKQWGSDHRASLDFQGFRWMVQQVRRVELAMGLRAKRIHPEELEAANKLRFQPVPDTAYIGR